MTLSSTSILDIVELALYLPLAPITIYLGWRHGRHGLLGHLYLHLCCLIHIVADIVALATSTHSGSVSLASTILSSVGLSPLLLAIAGFLHETHRYLYLTTTTAGGTRSSKTVLRWLWIVQCHIHSLVIVAMVLFVMGAVKIATSTENQDIANAGKLRKAGAALLVLSWFLLLDYAVYLFWRAIQTIHSGFTRAIGGIVLAATLTGVRVLYTAVYVFDASDKKISPYDGDLALRVALVFLVSILAVIAAVVVSWQSLDLFHYAIFRQTDSEVGNIETHHVLPAPKAHAVRAPAV